ncbi:MAG: DUF2027 domain-containing protein [Alloprevotella sp.]
MKIGDKVRFLNAVGGGVVSGFPGKGLVNVTDEDGFDIPVLESECVVIDTDDYNIAKVNTGVLPGRKPAAAVQEAEPDPADRPLTFRPRPLERKGGDKLEWSLGFVPQDIRGLSDTRFDLYFINDSNYNVHFALSTDGASGTELLHAETVEANSKLCLQDLTRPDLPRFERLRLQAICWKPERPYLPKSPVDTAFRVDATKFYKLHTFAQTPFFDVPAYLVPLIREDKVVEGVYADAASIRKALLGEKAGPADGHKAAQKQAKGAAGLLEVDLHADSLLDTTAGMDSKAILDYQMQTFRRVMDENRRHTGRRIVFIHGKGDGVLRRALLDELRHSYKSCRSQDASFREYGYGATMVVIA